MTVALGVIEVLMVVARVGETIAVSLLLLLIIGGRVMKLIPKMGETEFPAPA